MIEAEVVLMREALAHPDGMDYFHLISGHNYPCRSNADFDAFFESSPSGRSYMHFDSDEQHEEWKSQIRNRFVPYHFHDRIKNRYIRGGLERLCNIHREFVI